MKIVTEFKKKSRRKRFGQKMISLFGTLLVLIGLGLTIPVLAGILITFLGPDDIAELWSDLWWSIIAGLIGVVFVLVGLRIVHGKKRIVLFLRRFGFSGSSRALTFAAGTATGRRWRLVTLDDSKIGAKGISKKTRFFVRAGFWLFLVLVLLIMYFGLNWFHGSGIDGAFDSSGDWILEYIKDGDYDIMTSIILFILIAFVGGALVIGFALFAYLSATIFIPLIFITGGAIRSTRKAERKKAVIIIDKSEIDSTVFRVVKRLHKVYAPRLVVVKVAEKIWKQVVEEFSMVANVVLIDISEPSDNLLWEIRMLKDKGQSNWILVGQEDKVLKIKEGKVSGDDRLARDLKMQLEEKEVLVYRAEDRSSMKHFARALRHRLENIDLEQK